jgi:hypothetical protein
MAKIKCTLIAHSISRHLQHIYTGFNLLHKRGIIDVSQEIVKENMLDDTKEQHLRDHKHAQLKVILNDTINIFYDTHDSGEIDEQQLATTDYYFKRSYSTAFLQPLGQQKEKVYPMGLYYPILPNGFDKLGVQRAFSLANGRKKISEALSFIEGFDSFRYTARVNDLWAFPDYGAPPKILFMVMAYDPHDKQDRPDEKVEERRYINEARAQCIAMLRKEYKDNFYGGFIHTAYAAKHYKEFLMPDKTLSSRKNYMNLLKSYPICLATTGLHLSIGAKFAEYIAFSKAILTEKLNFEVPGNLQKDKNYLEFSTPENCVENAEKLFSDKVLRNSIMTNNAKYFHAYMRPDVLVLNTLLTTLGEEAKK